MATRVQSAGTARVRQEDLIGAFEGPIEPIGASFLYLVGLIVVSLVMVLLPLIYLGVMAALAYGLYYHATENAGILQVSSAGTHTARGRVVVYLAPLIVGGVALLFMFKPLFSRYRDDERRLSLKPENEPLLYEFISALCRQIGRPEPRRIDVNLSINASAGFRRGLLSFLGNDLVLTIGLPLAAAMNVNELTGVMAHEFGHFTQGLAMRLNYLIRSINGWFARVVYERDRWDETLADWTERLGGWVSIIGYLAMLFVWLTRRVLWCLMMLGHAISCFMSRQMEFDADLHQVRVAGGEAFASAFRKLHLLQAAQARANAEINRMLHDRKLPDNLPVFVHSAINRLPEAFLAIVDQGLAETKTGLLDTHPADGTRIERARLEDTSGIFHLEAPAGVLFGNFDLLCREATRFGFDGALEGGLAGVQLVPTAVAKVEQEAAAQGIAALDRYFQRLWLLDRPLGLTEGEIEPPAGAAEGLERLRRTRRKIEEALPQARKLVRKYREVHGQESECRRARTLLEAGAKIDAASFNLQAATRDEARSREATHRLMADKMREKLALVDAAQRKRLLTALALLEFDEICARVDPFGEQRRSGKKYLAALFRLEAASGLMDELRQWGHAAGAAIEALRQDDRNDRAMGKLRDLMPRMHEGLIGLRSILESDPYPFEHPEEDLSIGTWAVQVPPFADDLGNLLDATGAALDRLNSLYVRLISQLVTTAEKIESAAGLDPLPAPPKEEEKEA